MLFHRRDVLKRHMAVHEPSPTKKRRRARRGVVPVISQSRLGQRSSLAGADDARPTTSMVTTVQSSSTVPTATYQSSGEMLHIGTSTVLPTTTDYWPYNQAISDGAAYDLDTYSVGSSAIESPSGDLTELFSAAEIAQVDHGPTWSLASVAATPYVPVPGTLLAFSHPLAPLVEAYGKYHLEHFPCVHPSTLRTQQLPEGLVNAMAAIGSLYYGSPRADTDSLFLKAKELTSGVVGKVRIPILQTRQLEYADSNRKTSANSSVAYCSYISRCSPGGTLTSIGPTKSLPCFP